MQQIQNKEDQHHGSGQAAGNKEAEFKVFQFLEFDSLALYLFRVVQKHICGLSHLRQFLIAGILYASLDGLFQSLGEALDLAVNAGT